MHLERQPSASISKRKHQTKKKKGQFEQLQAEIKSFNSKDAANMLLPTVLAHVPMTKESCTGIAKAIAKKQKVAVKKAKKTATYLISGLPTILHPENPKKLQSMHHNNQPTVAP